MSYWPGSSDGARRSFGTDALSSLSPHRRQCHSCLFTHWGRVPDRPARATAGCDSIRRVPPLLLCDDRRAPMARIRPASTASQVRSASGKHNSWCPLGLTEHPFRRTIDPYHRCVEGPGGDRRHEIGASSHRTSFRADGRKAGQSAAVLAPREAGRFSLLPRRRRACRRNVVARAIQSCIEESGNRCEGSPTPPKTVRYRERSCG